MRSPGGAGYRPEGGTAEGEIVRRRRSVGAFSDAHELSKWVSPENLERENVYRFAPDSGHRSYVLAPRTKQILKDDLNNIPGQEVLFFTSDWPPGFRLPWHMHEDAHEFVFVLEGEQTFEVDGIGTKVVKAGEVIHTLPNVPHYGRNASDKISKTLVIRIRPKDKPITTEIKRD
jgi:quercetin dioxygenase-like cupin family protein